MIVRKDAKSVSFFKIGIIPPHGLNERFSFIWALHSFCFCPSWADKNGDFSQLHSIVYVHPPSSHLLRTPPRLLIDFKNSRWLAWVCILSCIIMHLLLFLLPDWITFCHMIISYIFYLFSVSLWWRANTQNVRVYYIHIGNIPTFLYLKLL